MVAEPEGSTPLIPKPATGQDPEPVLSTSDPYPIILLYPPMQFNLGTCAQQSNWKATPRQPSVTAYAAHLHLSSVKYSQREDAPCRGDEWCDITQPGIISHSWRNTLTGLLRQTTGRDRLVSTVSRLRDGRPGLDSLQGQRIFSLCHRIQTGSGAQPASYSVGTGGSFPGAKVAGAWRWSLTFISWQV
jgi:hypothetical protein